MIVFCKKKKRNYQRIFLLEGVGIFQDYDYEKQKCRFCIKKQISNSSFSLIFVSLFFLGITLSLSSNNSDRYPSLSTKPKYYIKVLKCFFYFLFLNSIKKHLGHSHSHVPLNHSRQYNII